MVVFNFEDVRFHLPGRRDLKNWIRHTIEQEMKLAGDVSFIFVSDEYLYQMNMEYLSHDTLTDVITFDYSEGNVVSGDIFISVPRVRENAATFADSFYDELYRVMIHGVLHLLGYKDKSRKEAAEMRQKENLYLLLRCKSE